MGVRGQRVLSCLERQGRQQGPHRLSYVKYKEGITKAKALEFETLSPDGTETRGSERRNTTRKSSLHLPGCESLDLLRQGPKTPIPYIPQTLQVNDRMMPCKLISDEFAEYFEVIKEVYKGRSKT